MSKKNTFLLFTVLSLCGCTWSHPNKNEVEFYQDKMECQQYAQGQAPQQPSIPPGGVAGMTKQQMGAAYGAQTGNSIGTGFQQGGYFRDCMKAKGYQ